MGTLLPYAESDRADVEAFLRDPAGTHVYLASRLDDLARGEALLFRHAGLLAGVAWFGTGQNLVFAGEDPEFVHALAAAAADRELRWLMVVGPWGPVTDFLGLYGPTSRRRPRLDRVQELYLLTPETLASLREPGLRPAREEDLEELAASAARMSAEDFEIDPWRIDRGAVRRAVGEKVREGRSFLLRENGRLVFKVDIAARTAEGAQVEGVFTVEDRRGRGLASRCVAELGHRMLAELPLLSLHVARGNLAARKAYENAGYRPAGQLRLAIFTR